jgi:hypothetical protein
VEGMLNTRGHQHPDFWMRLDNAAKIYPAVQSEELTAVFRLSCILKNRIKIMPLLKAVHLIEDLFPYYLLLIYCIKIPNIRCNNASFTIFAATNSLEKNE